MNWSGSNLVIAPFFCTCTDDPVPPEEPPTLADVTSPPALRMQGGVFHPSPVRPQAGTLRSPVAAPVPSNGNRDGIAALSRGARGETVPMHVPGTAIAPIITSSDRTSWIYAHVTASTCKTYVTCNICSDTVPKKLGSKAPQAINTTNVSKHLMHHGLTPPEEKGSPRLPVGSDQPSVEADAGYMTPQAHKRPRSDVRPLSRLANVGPQTTPGAGGRSAQYQWTMDRGTMVFIAETHQPLSLASSSAFRTYTELVSGGKYVPSCTKTLVEKHLKPMCEEFCDKRLIEAVKAGCWFHSSTDGWKMGRGPGRGVNRYFIGHTVSWLDENFERHKACLSISELIGGHTRQNIADHLLPQNVVPLKSIVSWATDNALEDSMAIKIIRDSEPGLAELILQIKCWCHTLNLAVQDALKVLCHRYCYCLLSRVSLLMAVQHELIARIVQACEAVVSIFMKSHHWTEYLYRLQQENGVPPEHIRTLVKTVETRWYSTGDMVQGVSELFGYIIATFDHFLRSTAVSATRAKKKAWAEARDLLRQVAPELPILSNMLATCRAASMAAESDHGTVSQLLATSCQLVKLLEVLLCHCVFAVLRHGEYYNEQTFLVMLV